MSDHSGWTQRLRLLALLVPRVRCAHLLHLPDRQVGKFEEKNWFFKVNDRQRPGQLCHLQHHVDLLLDPPAPHAHLWLVHHHVRLHAHRHVQVEIQ